jgi:hypothetical protein
MGFPGRGFATDSASIALTDTPLTFARARREPAMMPDVPKPIPGVLNKGFTFGTPPSRGVEDHDVPSPGPLARSLSADMSGTLLGRPGELESIFRHSSTAKSMGVPVPLLCCASVQAALIQTVVVSCIAHVLPLLLQDPCLLMSSEHTCGLTRMRCLPGSVKVCDVSASVG